MTQRTAKEVFKRPVKTLGESSQYNALLTAVRTAFTAAVKDAKHVFATDATGLWDLYLESLPEAGGFRQRHTCHACKSFIEKYGGLVSIDSETGVQTPLMWYAPSIDGLPYAGAFSLLNMRVKAAKVTGVFFTSALTWGQPTTRHKGEYHHLSVNYGHARSLLHHTIVTEAAGPTPDQLTADYRERYNTVQLALADVSVSALEEAVRVFESEALDRSEKFLELVRWLLRLKQVPKLKAPAQWRHNRFWSAVAEAPVGFTHPRASVVWPLIEDIKAGTPFDEMKRKFHAMVAPLQYQRPQAAPSEGAVKQAEALFERLGLAPALERRFARLEDVVEHAVWTPRTTTVESTPTGKVFAHLATKDAARNHQAVPHVDLPPAVLTLARFVCEVLPAAERLEVQVPWHGRFLALTTAVHADAPPILKWGNPVAWYVYPDGSDAAQWGLGIGVWDVWVPVTAVVPLPTTWSDQAPMAYLSEGLVLILKGCVDSRAGCGNALFPESLKSELYGVRSVVEAYSRKAELQGREEASACGYDLRKGACDCRVRALKDGRWAEYQIDRWR